MGGISSQRLFLMPIVLRLIQFDLYFSCSGLEDGSVVIWNPLEEDETKRKRILPQKHSDWVRSLLFSPDGQFLASDAGLNDELIIIWSTEVRNKVEMYYQFS